MNKKIISDIEKNKEQVFENLAIDLLSKKYRIDLKKILTSRSKTLKLSSEEQYFPVGILSQGLSSLEAIVKYLRENKKMSYETIGKLLARNPKTLAVSYNIAKKKMPKMLDENMVLTEQKNIPFKIFTNDSKNNLSILESIVKYLHDSGQTYSQIGRMTGKDPRTIWTVYTRVKKKLRIKG